MANDMNDPRLTAYALGELDGKEKQAVETLIEQNADARAEVEAIRRAAEQIRTELTAEASLALTDEQRQSIADAARQPAPQARPFWPRFFTLGAAAAAACACVVIFFTVMRNRGNDVAMRESKADADRAKPAQTRTAETDGPVGLVSLHDTDDDGVREAPELSQLRREAAGAESAAPATEVETPPPPAVTALTDAPEKIRKADRPVTQLTAADQSTVARPAEPDRLAGSGPAGGPGPMPEPAPKPKPMIAHFDVNAADTNGAQAATKQRQDALQFGARLEKKAEHVVGQTFSLQSGAKAPEPQNYLRREVAREARDKELGENEQERRNGGWNREAYDRIVENPFINVDDDPLSTFSIDVDTASYANVRRFLTQGTLPPPDAVRIEELINTFTYDYPQPSGDVPFSVNVDVSQCPWQTDNRLVRIGLKGREVQFDKRPVSNLVFLLDVSGSMNRPNKLPLLVKSMKLLVDQLGENDHVAITVYAGASGLVLPPTSGENKGTIMEALDRLRAGGSTNGGAGIELAYRTAQENFVNGGVNRVILATDGDFNVGVTNRGELTRLIEEKAKAGVFLTVLGFGMGNLQDATLEQLADKGNGNYAYIDGEREARRVLVEQIGGTLVTIAKDVKIQVEFNPAQVAAYRLVGYENRMLAHRDFNDDTKDAGEIGAGHTVTAFYEIVPAGADNQPVATVGNLRYQRTRALADEAASGELMTVKLRYKEPDGQTSKLIQQPVKDRGQAWRDASDDFRFAASVATFGMILRGSQFARNVTLGYVAEEAQSALGDDPGGYRREFVDLVKKAQALKNGR